MKVGIINLAWANDNYGAILQAMGLEQIIRNMGYEVETINIYHKIKISDFFSKNGIKTILRKAIFVSNINNAYSLVQFRMENMNLTRKVFYDIRDFYEYKFDFDTCIVGSDQVWKDVFIDSEWVKIYFLDFLPNDINKIAYAASFGGDTWTAKKDITQYIRNTLQQFNAVSVRELSGVKICNEILGVKAQLTVDPSLLIGRDFWERIVDRNNSNDHNSNIVFFLINKNKRKMFMQLIAMIKKKSGKQVKEISQHNLLGRFFEPIPIWLRKIKNAEFVITDSLHGICFSIVFERQFIVYMPNKNETLTRIVSLLSQLGISERLISNADEEKVDNLLRDKIDYSQVNKLLEEMRESSMNFLKKALNRQEKQ